MKHKELTLNTPARMNLPYKEAITANERKVDTAYTNYFNNNSYSHRSPQAIIAS